jgi:hypothetical protein
MLPQRVKRGVQKAAFRLRFDQGLAYQFDVACDATQYAGEQHKLPAMRCSAAGFMGHATSYFLNLNVRKLGLRAVLIVDETAQPWRAVKEQLFCRTDLPQHRRFVA